MKKMFIILIALLFLFYWTKPIGDVNLNGKVTITDLVILHRYIDGLEELTAWEYDRADMNRDGIVDEKDYIKLQRVLAGLE